ncbi:MAG TPA: serine hydrolase domain-containing protein [Symbiobacteriaceae bacterium]|nr:serine hydrolase domain-containing protein [Symbiobacteriaceae bacterium]
MPGLVGNPIDRALQDMTKAGTFSGAVLIVRDGKTILSKGYGLADRERNVPVTPLTRFRIGSISKHFTAAAVLLLNEQEKLAVTDPICRYMADCPPQWQGMTIHHLLTHTAGLNNHTDMQAFHAMLDRPTDMAALMDLMRQVPVRGKPGDEYRYGNSGYMILTYIVEQVSGQPYHAFMDSHFFDPLGLENSGTVLTESDLSLLADGYRLMGGQVYDGQDLHPSILQGDGALYSTVWDLHRWGDALYGDKVLSRASRNAMFTAHVPVDTTSGYGYGWSVQRGPAGEAHLHRGASSDGFEGVFLTLPDEKLRIVILTNLFGADLEAVLNVCSETLLPGVARQQ